MCGITGILAFNLVGKFNRIHVTNATMALEKRGPDFQDIYTDEWVGLGHRRLSIIDTRSVAHQPMWDDQKRYCIIFNGEIFNFRELRAGLIAKGISFRTESDTEVLLKLYIAEGEACLNKLNGFFAFAIYDKQEESLFVARDRFGVKPLLYVFDEDKFIFASEMKAMMAYGLEKSIDYNSLYLYLQLNYIPAPDTIFTNIKKLLPGHFIKVSKQQIDIQRYYHIPYDHNAAEKNRRPYADVQKEFSALLETAVLRRLVSDVPLGAFLSGGIDSSVITALAARHKPDLHTFSIGFRDEKFFDETHYAQLVAKKFKTQHTVFSLTNDDLYRHLHDILNYIDEPFADSSAIAVYILSRETRKHATVALSGDGADELLSGYNKHAAHYRVMHPGIKESLVSALGPVWKMMPQSRNGTFSNKFRQLSRFAQGMKLTSKERYWQWATLASNEEALRMLHPELRMNKWLSEYVQRRKNILQHIPDQENINDILYTDMQLVLPNDMLTKVDLMSMANGLEVRSPFLDVDVVNFAFSLPSAYKINHKLRKRIVQDAFRKVLPSELYNRPKKGFEVPLLKWFRRELKGEIMDNWLSEKFIREQAVFDYAEIKKLKEQLFSANPGDVHARIWGLIVFQSWWKKHIG